MKRSAATAAPSATRAANEAHDRKPCSVTYSRITGSTDSSTMRIRREGATIASGTPNATQNTGSMM